MYSLWRDAIPAWRRFRRSLGLSIVTVGVLGTGVGAATLASELAVDLRELSRGRASGSLFGLTSLYAPPPHFLPAKFNFPPQWRSGAPRDVVDALRANASHDLVNIAASTSHKNLLVRSTNRASEVQAEYILGDYWQLLERSVLLGQRFHGGSSIGDGVIISERLATRWWEEPSRALGQVVHVGSTRRPVEIVGVVSRSFLGMTSAATPTDLWLPVDSDTPRGFLMVFGRAGPDANSADVDRALREILTASLQDKTGVKALARVSVDQMLERPSLSGAFLIVGLAGILLFAAAATNVATLSTARQFRTSRDLALRRALGASRGSIARLVGTEAALLCAAGGVVAMGLVGVGTEALNAFARSLPYTSPWAHVNLSVNGMTVGLCLMWSALSFVFCAGAAAWNAIGSEHLQKALEAAPQFTTRRIGVAWTTLLALQVAAAVVFVMATAKVVLVLSGNETVRPLYRPEPLVIAKLTGREDRTELDLLQKLELLDVLRGRGDIKSAALVDAVPAAVTGPTPRWSTMSRPSGTGVLGAPRVLDVLYVRGSPGTFGTLDRPLLAGRDIAPGDGPGAPRVAVITESVARVMWPNQDAVGKLFLLGPSEPFTVVGVASDLAVPAEAENPSARPIKRFANNLVVVPIAQWYATARDTYVLVSIKDRNVGWDYLHSTALPTVAVVEATSVAEILAGTKSLNMLVGFGSGLAVLTMLIAATAVYATSSFITASKAREIGIRLALGSQPRAIVLLILNASLRPVLVGTLVGVLVTAVSERGMMGFTDLLAPNPVVAWVVTLFIVDACAIFAAVIPAIRMVQAHPEQLLRV